MYFFWSEEYDFLRYGNHLCFFRAPVVLRSSINICSYYYLTPQISIIALQLFWEKALETAVCVRSYEVFQYTHVFAKLIHNYTQMDLLILPVFVFGRCDLHVCSGQYAVSDCDVVAVVACLGGTATAQLPLRPASPAGPSQQTPACRHTPWGTGAAVATTWSDCHIKLFGQIFRSVVL